MRRTGDHVVPSRSTALAHRRGRAAAVLLVLGLGPAAVHARCDPTTEPDRSDVARARAAVATACDCAGAASRGAYVQCALAAARAVLANPTCAGAVRRCAARSRCGDPRGVACCRTRPGGQTSCAIKSQIEKCTAPRGGSACAGTFDSCCDACASGGCAMTTSTTTTTTSTASESTVPSTSAPSSTRPTTSCPPTTTTTTLPPCGVLGSCSSASPCTNGLTCAFDPATQQCGCVGPPPVCGQWIGPSCGGTCPDGMACHTTTVGACGYPACECVPAP